MDLLDTNVVSELARNRPHGAVTAWLGGIAPTDVFISAVTLGELQAGIELTRRQDPQIELDVPIAATADVHRMTVVTRNVRDFTRLRVPLIDPFKPR